MKATRRLALRRETLTELSADELARAGAGAAILTLQEGCSLEDVYWYFSIHQHCTWTCIK